MNWTSSMTLTFALLATIACTPKKRQDVAAIEANTSKYLIETAELREIIENDTIAVLDLRKPEEYAKGHLPGAVNIWRTDIDDPTYPYNGVIAPREQIETLFGQRGISSSDFLILYDEKASCEAARLWWILDYFGFDRMAILNGGVRSWKEQGGLTEEVPVVKPAVFALSGNNHPQRLIKLQELENLHKQSNVVVLDTRSIEEYRGDHMKEGAFDKGRIPGSINMDWMYAMNPEDHTFKSKKELSALYENLGISRASSVVTYCHSGVRSAHTLFVLTQLLGYQDVRNYDGSWVEWSYHQLPIEQDSLIVN